jgi:AcrR family transcriptional regulator
MPIARLSSPERRAAIIESAIQLFAEKGFRGVTTREISQAVGVTEPVLYQHFPSKRDLYKAIIDSITESSGAGDPEPLFRRTGVGDDREFFAALAETLIDWHERNPAYIRLFLFSALEGNEVGEMLFDRHSCAFLDELTAHIRSRIDAGAFRAGDPALYAYHFIGLVGHYGIHLALFSNTKLHAPREAVISALVDIFLKGVQA